MCRWCLAGGIAFPVVYFATLLLAGSLYPGYDHCSQVPSILGTSAAPHPEIFNTGMVLTACAAMLGAVGLFVGLRRLRAGMTLSLFAATLLGLFALSIAMSGLFPLPNPLHYGFNLTLAGVLTPLFGALALRKRPRTRGARGIVLTGFAVSVVLLAINLGVGGVVDAGNRGLWLRALALVAFPTIAFLCWTVRGETNV